jgi:SAM-dependent methyltransferase
MKLHEMNPRGRFTSRADAYRRYRPDYPAALFDALLRDEPRIVADVGAGTGIASIALASRGIEVFAVEPNEAMREAGAQHERIHWIEGRAEATTLEGGSVDLVTCFQAFHWFDPATAIPEFLRVLRPEGAIAAVWNERDPDDSFTSTYGKIVREISDNHPAESRVRAAEALDQDSRLEAVELRQFPHQQTLDLEGLMGRASSTSYLPSSGPRHAELVTRLRQLFEEWRHEGTVTLRYRTSLYLTRAREQEPGARGQGLGARG